MGKAGEEAVVVKIGGSTLGSGDTTLEDAVALQKQGKTVIIVHGGGKLITEWLAKQGVNTGFVQGERVTDRPALDVVSAVLSGLVNKDIVSKINCLGGRAFGMSGVDGALIRGVIENEKLGYVGRVERIEPAPLETLINAGFIPVISPVAFFAVGRAAGEPGMLNMNADIAAGEIAAAVRASQLIFLTDVAGILDRLGNVISVLVPETARELIASGVASGGMIPKITSCLATLRGCPSACIIDGRRPHALVRELEGEHTGTVFRSS